MRILASTSVPFGRTAVHMTNLALIETKRITVHVKAIRPNLPAYGSVCVCVCLSVICQGGVGLLGWEYRMINERTTVSDALLYLVPPPLSDQIV
jgi:hypothetical protein